MHLVTPTKTMTDAHADHTQAGVSSRGMEHLGQQIFQLGTVCLQLCNLMAKTAHGLHTHTHTHTPLRTLPLLEMLVYRTILWTW